MPTSFSSPTSTTSYIFEAAIPLAFTAGSGNPLDLSPNHQNAIRRPPRVSSEGERGFPARHRQRYVKLAAFLAASVLADDRVRATDGTVGAGAAWAAAGSRSGEERMMAPAVILTTEATRKR